MHDYFLIPYFCQIFTPYSRGLKILVRISRFWLEYFCWSRLLISFKIYFYIIFENRKRSLMLIISFIERTLGWFSSFFIAISTGSSNFTVSIRYDLFSIMPREFTAVLKHWFKFFSPSLSSVTIFPSFTKEMFVVLTPLSERRTLTVFRKSLLSVILFKSRLLKYFFPLLYSILQKHCCSWKSFHLMQF